MPAPSVSLPPPTHRRPWIVNPPELSHLVYLALAGGAGALKLSDLLAGLGGDAKKKLGAARKLLEKVGGAAGDRGVAPVSVPLPSVVAERQERKAGYEAAAKDVSKWTSIVKVSLYGRVNCSMRAGYLAGTKTRLG